MPSPIKSPSSKPDGKDTPTSASTPSDARQSGEHFEGDYRPTASKSLFHPHASDPKIRVEPLQVDFLRTLADALNATLDLNTLMHRVADLVRAVIDYRIFAILLINERAQDLRMRFQVGHTPEVERMRVKMGRGIVGQAALLRQSILVEDVTEVEHYINANPNVRSELAVPLVVKNKVIGVLDIESETAGYFTLEHQHLIELVASRMAIAIENARLYTRVSRQAQTLAVLNEISREITSILDLDDLLERIGLLLKRVIDFQMFSILLLNERTGELEHRFSSRYGERITLDRIVPLGQGIIGLAAQQREPLVSSDTRKDPRYIAANPETRSELAAPLLYKGKVIGVLDLEHTRVNYYNEDHQRTLSTLAAQIAISIANARLYQRISDEEQRMESDLEMARKVQLRLMPTRSPKLANAEIAAKFLAARSIGGDLYDFLDYGQGRIALAIGDVSGKAAPAALYAALVSGILRSLAPQHLSPAAMLTALNDQLQERKLDAQYVTMLFAVWDDNNRTLQIANAGSVQPLFVPGTISVANGPRVRTINAEGFPLGLFPQAVYEEFTFSTQPGDQIVFFSDGIVDAENANHDMFGNDRLEKTLASLPNPTASSTVKSVLDAVEAFQAGMDHFDDETLVVLHVN
ncbi:SpoIIE family protein phosphatase [Edaphobacter acidisoli]|nr:SpoIIE family protein phosphatase [Edaphobacter acidisoli]